jgi:hypothetical protein
MIVSRDNERLTTVRKLHDGSQRTARCPATRHPAPSERLGAFDFRGAWLDWGR